MAERKRENGKSQLRTVNPRKKMKERRASLKELEEKDTMK